MIRIFDRRFLPLTYPVLRLSKSNAGRSFACLAVWTRAVGTTRGNVLETTPRSDMSDCCFWRKTSPPAYPRSYHGAWAASTSRRGRPHAASFQPARMAAFRPGATRLLKITTCRHPLVRKSSDRPETQNGQAAAAVSAGFAIDSTRRRSDPVLAASGFTVSEVGSVCAQRRHDVMN